MIQLLSERQNPANDFKLQHGILGALRNFAVTPQARQILLDKGKVISYFSFVAMPFFLMLLLSMLKHFVIIFHS
jgi:hypothetical protein